jgi:septal ring factor EnvC (AmiA/AmiB activator)
MLMLALSGVSAAHGQAWPAMQTGWGAAPVAPTAALDQQLADQVSRIEQLDAERARAEAEVASLTESRAQTNRRLRERTRALYRLTRAGALPLSGGFNALLQHLSRRERLERVVRGDLEALGDLQARSSALQAEASQRATELEAARATLHALQAQRAEAEQAMFAAALTGGAPAFATDFNTVASSGFGIRLADPSPAPTNAFEAQRGQLMIPLLSPTNMRAGQREEGAGIEMSGAAGTSVRAAADGRVAFAQTHSAYGRLVILDHGGSYFTIYGGLGRATVSVGQTLARGAELGVLDTAPVFFQVRRGTRALDARIWLGL